MFRLPPIAPRASSNSSSHRATDAAGDAPTRLLRLPQAEQRAPCGLAVCICGRAVAVELGPVWAGAAGVCQDRRRSRPTLDRAERGAEDLVEAARTRLGR